MTLQATLLGAALALVPAFARADDACDARFVARIRRARGIDLFDQSFDATFRGKFVGGRGTAA